MDTTGSASSQGPAARDELPVPGSTLRIPRAELEIRTSPSGGPGGQHANRSATRVDLRWDVEASVATTEQQRALILERLGAEVRISVDDERSQRRNRSLAEERLVARVSTALYRDPPRRPTRPSRGSTQRRLDAKKRRSSIKRDRRRPID